ncbi:MipA/OmpV family protein [Thalassotalea sp. HSM 43]|uniref:MipA/OmpV family protein n=1 Tax=Thalassotalea sp. HSM 43 TaxID=2552945 RepID=UPI001675AD99|nr:MipA/OmpV family protein [Thalassotalea sp. HSM 43]
MRLVVCFLFAVFSITVNANDNDCSGDCIATNSWSAGIALGLGELSNPLHQGRDRNVSVLPAVYFYGERFYLENTTLGYTLFENDHWSIDIKGELNKDGIYFRDSKSDQFFATGTVVNPFPLPIPIDSDDFIPEQDVERDLSYMGGVGISYFFADEWLINLDLLSDVSGVHHGQQVDLSVFYTKEFGKLSFNLSVGALYQSSKLNNYYYGFDNNEFAEYDVQYKAGGGVNPYASVGLAFPVSKYFSLVANYKYEQLSSEISHSSLVNDDSGHFYFFGISGHIGNH